MRRKVWAAVSLVLAVALSLSLSAFASAAGQSTGGGTKTITVHNTTAECVPETPDEWHFVITQIDTLSHAPASITAVFSDGTEVISRDTYTGHTAHYRTTSHQGATLTTATATIYSSWSGQFNLSHQPCRQNTASLRVNVDCQGWAVVVTASEGASFSAPSGSWTDPHALESVAAGSVEVTWDEGVPESITLDYPQIDEPTECNPTNSAILTVVNDCQGWHLEVVASDGAEIPELPSGAWVDPYTLEEASAGVVTVSWPTGSPASIDLPYGPIEEPEECLIVLEHDYKLSANTDCTGWEAVATSLDGGVFTPDGPMSGSWSDPYSLETASVSGTWLWPDGYTVPDSLTINEPEGCLVSRNSLSVDPIVTCEGWSVSYEASEGAEVTVSPAPSGDWSEGNSVEVTVTATWESGEPLTVSWSQTLTKPEDCEEPTGNTAEFVPKVTCQRWEVEVAASEGATVEFLTPSSGVWGETTTVDVAADVSWEEGEPALIHLTMTLNRPPRDENGNCIVQPPEPPRCVVNCDRPQQERLLHNHILVDWFNNIGCDVVCGFQVYIVTDNPDAVVEYHGERLEWQQVVNSQGTFYVIQRPRGDGAYVFWTADGRRYRDVYGYDSVDKYEVCSVWPGWWSVEGNEAVFRDGQTASDWLLWLLEEGFFPRTWDGARQAQEWANQLRELGRLLLPSH